MQVRSIEGRLVHRVITVGHAAKLLKPDIMEGWERAKEVSNKVPTRDFRDIKVSLNWRKLFPEEKTCGGSLLALLQRISIRNKQFLNEIGTEMQSLIEVSYDNDDEEAASQGLFTFIPILRQETVTCSVQTAANEFAPGEQAVSAWDHLVFSLSDSPRSKRRTFVATEDRLTASVPGEYQFSPAVVHDNTQIRIIKIPRSATSNGTVLHQLVRTRHTF